MNTCLSCKNAVSETGAPAGDMAHRLFCKLALVDEQPTPCEAQRFALADRERGVCGTDGIFWEPK